MPLYLPHTRHLVRMAGLFTCGILAFLMVRHVLVPKDFGNLGHYRAGALDDNKARALAHAGKAACLECHGDIPKAMETKKSGHRTIGCEACHGPLADHAANSGTLKPRLPDPRLLCLRCHAEDPARPAFLPQKDPKRHNPKAACTDCHNPHAPRMEDGT